MASVCNCTKSNTPPWEFFTFLNCTNGIKSRKTSHLIELSVLTSIMKFSVPCGSNFKQSIMINIGLVSLSLQHWCKSGHKTAKKDLGTNKVLLSLLSNLDYHANLLKMISFCFFSFIDFTKYVVQRVRGKVIFDQF